MGILVGLLISAGNLYANIDNLSNMSAEWIRTGNRNAATDAADIVVYNPGGITQLPEGFMVNIGNQTLIRKPKHSYDLSIYGLAAGPESHEQDGIDWFLPNVYMTYNKDNWALFGGYYIPGGGAVVDYPDGSITTDIVGLGVVNADPLVDAYTGDYLKAESVYNTLTFGGAYQINDRVSAAFGLRYIMVQNNIKAGLTGLTDLGGGIYFETPLRVDVDEEDEGLGFVAGVNVNITPEMNLGIQYQSKVALDLESKVNQDDLGLFADGEKNARDLPGMLGLGLGYDISHRLYMEVNYSYWFQKDADWGTEGGKDISDMAGDAQSFGITASYKLTPTLLASVGTTYTDFRWKDIEGYYEANLGSYEVLYTDNWHVGCGVAWTVVDHVDLNLSLAQTLWDDKDLTSNRLGVPVEIQTENSTTIVAVGVNVSF